MKVFMTGVCEEDEKFSIVLQLKDDKRMVYTFSNGDTFEHIVDLETEGEINDNNSNC
jgi:hypothetical protein